ncbi:Nn.00g106820.m01.CDS01 [Neocucurbitaria sp. VM-36]
MLVSYDGARSILVLIPSLVIVYVVSRILYNLFLHPLRSFPGPVIARATVLTYQKRVLTGYSHKWLQELHQKYGPVVRFSPNELSFIQPEVWKEVYGHRATDFQKDKTFYGPDVIGDPPGLIRANNINHARQRKLVSYAFSDKALRDQEQLLKSHVCLLIEKLKEVAGQGPANMVEWYNFTTFDIMADLTFGESLGQLSNASYNPWVKAVFGFLKIIPIAYVCRSWPGVTGLLNALIPADVKKKRKTHISFSKERVDKRMARKTDRPDIWTFVTRHSELEGKGLAPTELLSNGSLFMLAGTETTATELSGLTYLLLKNPAHLGRLTKEVRSAFSSFDDMTMTKLSQLEFLNACLEEGLRLYPPLPVGLPRTTPESGARICGHWVAGGTTVQSPIYAASRSPINWTNPETFAPERFLPEGREEYGADRKDALNTFSFGPRNCLGKNLAYHEMRLMLASVLFHFDLELCNENEDWLDQQMYVLWDKMPLLVDLKPSP